MRLHDLLADLELADVTVGSSVEVRGDRGVDVGSVVLDTHDVAPGALFCCVRGARYDGHELAREAVASGAVALLVERWLDIDVPQLRVPDVRAALGPVAAGFHGQPSRAMRVVGITGTNGKTTTTYLLEQIAKAAAVPAGVIGTTGARVGEAIVGIPHTTPEATELQALLARMRDDGVDMVAIEVSSHALDQRRVDGTRFTTVCFTNLSHDHLDYHGSLDDYFEAKARLFTPVFSDRAAIGVDDEHGRALAARARAAGLDVCTFSSVAGGDADVTVTDVALDERGAAFHARHLDQELAIRTPLVGAFNVANALAAFCTAGLAGFGPHAIVAGLAAPIVVPGRMELVSEGAPIRVFVDYAHTPDALGVALETARALTSATRRLIVVFGCGGDRDRAKRPLMGDVATRAADVAYLTSDNPRSEDPEAIAHDVLAGVAASASAPVVELDRRAAIRAALHAAQAGDVVVIAGKGHESGQTASGVTVPFNDRVVAREELGGARMTAMSAAEIARRTNGRVEGDGDAWADSWAFDSRRLAAGACFFALSDVRDGHDFVPAAFDAGAHVAVVDRPLDGVTPGPGRALVVVDDTLRALQGIARSVRADRDDLHVVAVAGSTGKTSTKDLLAAILAPLGCHANAESHNNEFGLPLTICNVPSTARVLVSEMGERLPGDLTLLCDIARPHAGLVTNVGLAHAEHLGGFEGAAEVLSELLRALPADGVAVLNADDPWTDRLAKRTEATVVTVGRGPRAQYQVDGVQLDDRLRPSFILHTPDRRGNRLRVPLHGAHHVTNAAMAAAVAHHVFGMSFADIAVQLKGASVGRWRMELRETDDGITILNDAYNANPTSMEAALVALAHLPVGGRRLAVLGDMRELGAHARDAHRAVGARAAGLELDAIVGVGPGGALIGEAALVRGAHVELVANASAALDLIDASAAPGDAVLCKASRAVGLEVVADGLLARRRRETAPG